MLLLVYSAILSSINIIVQGLPVRSDLELRDVFISVKTTGKFHESRVQPILDTWHSLAPGHTWFFTDTEDEQVSRRLSAGHLVQTGCPSDHSRQSLCCKMQAELGTFLATTNKKWFCHVVTPIPSTEQFRVVFKVSLKHLIILKLIQFTICFEFVGYSYLP